MTKFYTIIFGLTADPIHKGHEQAIINGVHYLKGLKSEINEMVLLPVFQPHLIANKKAPKADFEQRVHMCEIVANRLSNQVKCKVIVSKIEEQIAKITGQNNYSLNTIKHLKKENCLFMVSADHFHGRWPKFRKWFGWKEILKYSGLLINQRPGHKVNKSFIKQLREINPNIFLVENQTSINTSSSQIRANFYSTGRDELIIDKHLSKDVMDFIKNQGLYTFFILIVNFMA